MPSQRLTISLKLPLRQMCDKGPIQLLHFETCRKFPSFRFTSCIILWPLF